MPPLGFISSLENTPSYGSIDSKIGKAGDQQVANADKQKQNHGTGKSLSIVGNATGKPVNNASVQDQVQARDARSAKSSSARSSQDHPSTAPKEEANADSKKSSLGAATSKRQSKVAESSAASEASASGEWGDIYDDISDDDEEEDDDEDDADGFDDAARPGQTATQYGWR
ncbi:hypothetical protein CBER1_03387 [Cercospora berteroae]|uniref:Uncharacterized protein n=1 Tax=Cercospora berteroae TaxID=357750 RepID=A0A2S6C8F5_9PEZI|nr:hypothetical protein CBER1_03387 [Cercospora berteroae]